MLEENVTSATPQNMAKIRGAFEVTFCSKMPQSIDIKIKPHFSNFTTSKVHTGRISKKRHLEICMSHFFAPINQKTSKVLTLDC